MDIAALEERAREVLTPMAYDYYAAGADDEITVRDNEAAWGRVRLLPKVLRDVSVVDMTASILGVPMAAPIVIAPMAAQRLAHDEGETAMARAAAATGTLMVLSTMSTVALEDVAAAAPDAPRWFQLYVHRDRTITSDLVGRAVAAGFAAMVLTVDLPVVGRRRRDEINGFDLPDGMQMENLAVSIDSMHGSGLAEYSDAAFDPSLTPDDIGWLEDLAGVPVIVKGVLRADDAIRCVDAGAAAIIVSNHGGRQVDGAVASVDALPAIVAAVGDRVPILVDGGIRGGYDVVKAVALGADAVLVGRPFLWGLAVGGADGAAAVMEELITELRRTMALCGIRSLSEIGSDLVAD